MESQKSTNNLSQDNSQKYIQSTNQNKNSDSEQQQMQIAPIPQSPSKFNEQVMDQKEQMRQSAQVRITQEEQVQSIQQILKQQIQENLQIQQQAINLQQNVLQQIISSTKQLVLQNQNKQQARQINQLASQSDNGLTNPHCSIRISHIINQIQNQTKPLQIRTQAFDKTVPIKNQVSKQKKSKIPSQQTSNTFKQSIKTSSSQSKFLQLNSSQIFVGQQTLLPNQVVCIQNNCTRVVVHMNKKIVPIPSSIPSNNLSPQKNKVTLPSPQCPYLLGKLIVTNYKIAYIDSLYPNSMNWCVPVNYICKLERTIQQSSSISFLQMTFKTGLTIKLKYHQQEFSYSQKIKDIILTLTHKNLYVAKDYGQQPMNKSILCKKFETKYFDEQKIKKDLKILQAAIIENPQWKEMPGYPQKYIIPLRYIDKKNVDSRLVVLSYIYTTNNQKIGLWRTGLGNQDPYEQQWVPKTRFSNKHYTIQIKNKGIGMSKTQATKSMQIQSLYLLRQSFHKLHQLTYHSHQSNRWFSNICSTHWYEQIALLMKQAQYVIQCMSSGIHITLLSETEARGAQISAIVQLLLNPYYRTIEGFEILVQKQFLHFGCPKPYKKQRQQDKSIILIQFFDCVYQFTHIFPLSFEFNQYYLVYLAEHVMSNKYGNFLYVTRQIKQNQRRQVVQKCVCIWQDIKRKIQKDKKVFFEEKQIINNSKKKANKKTSNPPIHQILNYYIYFKNSFYIDHNQSNIFELRNYGEVSKGIKFWSSYFTKKVYCSQSLKQQILFSNQIDKRYLKITYQHQQMKKINQVMRKNLSQQFGKINQNKKILKSLKELNMKLQ